MAILRRVDRDPMAVVAKRHGVSEQTICCWCPASGHLHSQVRQDMHRRYFPQLASNGPAGVCTYKGRVSVCVCRSLGYQMPFQRLYIYRCGTTNACALTGKKGDPRLPAPLAPDRWQFWMQTGWQSDRQRRIRLRPRDRGTSDRRHGLLPFYRLNQTARNSQDGATRNPPMGAAGFGKEDVEIEVKENTLSIRVRRKKADTERRFLYRGIPRLRASLQLADHVEMSGART